MNLLKYIALLLSLVTLLFSSKPNFTENELQWIKENPIVNFGADYRWPPFDFSDSDGNHTGLASEYIKLISKKSGLKINVQTGIWSDILNGMKAKKYDGLTCAVETKERKEYLKFTIPYLTVPMVIIIINQNNDIKNIDDLKGRKVAINKDSYIHEWLENKHPKINLHLTTSNEASLEAVSMGIADAYVGNQAVATFIMNKYLLNNLKIISKFKDFNTAVSVAIDKDNIILFDIIQKTLKNITPQEHQEIKKRWKENLEINKKLLTFTKKQQLWIDNHKTIRFVIDNQWKPIEYLSDDGKNFKGLSSSYLDLLSEKTGIKFQRIYTDTWLKSVEKINNREADLYTCVAQTDSRKKVVNFSDFYITMPQVFVTNKNKNFISDIRKLYGEKVVLVKGYYITEIIKKEHPQIDVLEVTTIKEAFESLTRNKAYAYIEILPVAGHFIQQEGFSNLKISGMSEYNSEFSMALRNDWGKEGIEVINIALASITEEEKNDIYNKWLRVEYDKKIDYTLLWQIIGLFLFFILGTLYWNRKLSIEIKKRKIAQAKLIETNKKLEEAIVIAQKANKSKSDFLSNMSHEIRTPMNTILGFAELLNKNIEDKKLKSFIKTILSSGQTLLHLINDILDLSKIESGKMEIKNNKINLENIVQESFDIFKLQAEEKGLKLELTFDKNISIPLFLDEIRLKEILINLIGNAIKFTDEGYIKILVKVDKHIDKVDLTFIVKDTGIGIPVSQQKKIFNIFEQAENQDIKKYGGTGLGLSISKKSAILMGGNIELESKLGVGSKFIVNLKNIDIITTNEKIQTNTLNIDFSTIEFKKATVLVVDNIKVNRDLIRESFSKTNIEVLDAVNVKEAVEIIKINKNINLIFMDIWMSNMDEYSEIKIIKRDTDIPVIALIASNKIDDFKKIKNKIFDGFLIKPVLIEKLFQELTKYLPYNKVNKIEKIHKEIKIENSEKLTLFLEEVNGDIKKLYKEVIKTNDINKIEIFIKKLYEVSLKYEIKYMSTYSELFLEKIDNFEIDAIDSMLKEYKEKIKKLKNKLNK